MCGRLLTAEDGPGSDEDRHGHVVDLEHRRILCTCRPCSLTFAPEGAGGSRFSGVPEDHLSLPVPVMTAAQWDRLQIPVGLAFFFINSSLERTVVMYPGPGGATESELEVEDWDQFVAANLPLTHLKADVQALLVRRGDAGGGPATGEDGFESYIVPIDRVYELIGSLKMVWKGFEGGQEAREAIADFFDDIRTRAEPVGAVEPSADDVRAGTLPTVHGSLIRRESADGRASA